MKIITEAKTGEVINEEEIATDVETDNDTDVVVSADDLLNGKVGWCD